ncbi:MAG: DUF6151 family protein [Polyangiaceae bacterium]
MSTQPSELPLRCKCGNVRGAMHDAAASTGNRLVCYCQSCQAFAKFLDRTDVLDKNGGTDIYQMAIGRVEITQGKDQLRALRLSAKGLIRWYADCCRTPIGNTVGPKLPFIGLILAFVDPSVGASARDAALGGSRGSIHTKDAVGEGGSLLVERGSAGILLRSARLMFGWWVTGKGSSVFFDSKTGAAVSTPKILSVQERAAVSS